MRRRLLLLPTGRRRVKLATRGSLVILRFAVGYQLHDKHRDGADQEYMNIAALMQKKL